MKSLSQSVLFSKYHKYQNIPHICDLFTDLHNKVIEQLYFARHSVVLYNKEIKQTQSEEQEGKK